MADQILTISMRDIEYNSNENLRSELILRIPELSLSVHSVTAIIGPNGSGKTTLLKLIQGLLLPTAGKIYSEFKSTSMVLHDAHLIKMSVRDNLKMLKGRVKKLTHAQIEEALMDFGLMKIADRPATKISAGEKQRVFLARAQLLGADLVLLDEPTSSIDPSATDQSELLIKKMIINGTKFLIASHDLAQVKRLSEDIVFLSQGEVIETGKTRTFFQKPQTELGQRFIERKLGWSSQ
ncbi:MAG: ATP-binding cassette domain-containing protein [Betaproteobacteria bacterium]